MKLKNVTMNLPCRLTQDELLSKADDLSRVVQEIASEEDRQSDIKAQMKATMTELEARKTRLALVVGRKEEYRDIDCQLLPDTEGRITVVRLDTGEVVLSRPMTDQERQLTLDDVA